MTHDELIRQVEILAKSAEQSDELFAASILYTLSGALYNTTEHELAVIVHDFALTALQGRPETPTA